MSWGISNSASKKEKIKADVNDYLSGLNSVGEIDYSTYSDAYDYIMQKLDDMSNLACDCDDEGYVIYDKIHKCYYGGMKSWKNLRQAQIFHSINYLSDRIKDIKDNPSVYGERDIIIRKVGLVILEADCEKEKEE